MHGRMPLPGPLPNETSVNSLDVLHLNTLSIRNKLDYVQRKGKNDSRKYFMINLHERILSTRRRSNPRPPDHQSDVHSTEPPRPAYNHIAVNSLLYKYQSGFLHVPDHSTVHHLIELIHHTCIALEIYETI